MKNSIKHEIIPFIAGFLLWIASGPFYFWGIIKVSLIGYKIGLIFLLGVIFYKRKRFSTKELYIHFIFFLGILLSATIPLISGNSNIFGFLSALLSIPLIFLAFSDKIFIRKVFDYFSKIYAVAIFISLIAWILMFLGLLPMLGIIENTTADRYYYHFPFVIVEQLNNTTIDEMIRFAGIYDEPGLVGTFSAFILYINKYQLNKPVNLVCFISGVCSFSFFFAIISIIYFLIYTFSSNGAFRMNRKIIFATIFFCFLLIGFYNLTKDNDLIYSRFWSRFEYDKNAGKLSGINRTTDGADEFYEELSFPEYLFGGDAEKYQMVAEGSSSYKSVIVNNGAVFLLVYMLFFLLYAQKRSCRKFNFILFVIFLFGNTYQRPDIYGIAVFFLYICLANDISRIPYKDTKSYPLKLV